MSEYESLKATIIKLFSEKFDKLQEVVRVLDERTRINEQRINTHIFMNTHYSWKTDIIELENRWSNIFQSRILPTRTLGDSKGSEKMLISNLQLHTPSGEVNQITNNIWLCNSDSAILPSVIKALNIGARINFCKEIDSRYLQCHLLEIHVEDSSKANIYQFFDIVYEFLVTCEEAKLNVLVNCRAGISRSPTILIAYLMRRFNMSFDDAMQYVKLCRPIVKPNYGFITQLQCYRKELDQLKSS